MTNNIFPGTQIYYFKIIGHFQTILVHLSWLLDYEILATQRYLRITNIMAKHIYMQIKSNESKDAKKRNMLYAPLE